ncbi:MAG: RNA polymerase sporulation sigma factor SigG [Oscillospiraceae bacterium]|nr:RNA polymerase sporulation sigma factor SigG [Oscillospiraceae bacterium]
MAVNYNKVEICGVDTTKLPVISEKEKLELIRKARSGDKNAREKMITCNLRLVLSVVQKFSNRGENLDDLFQVGCIGLVKAIDNFDCDLDVRFSTYGVPMIVGEIRRYLRDNNSVRVSRSMRDTAYKALQVRERMLGERLVEPTVAEIAAEMGVNRQEVVAALEAIVEPVSLYEPVYSDGGDTIYVMDQVGDPGGEGDWIDEISFREAIDQLGEREKKILSLRFFGGRTQMEVSKEIGISQAQVSRLEKSALDKIKRRM